MRQFHALTLCGRRSDRPAFEAAATIGTDVLRVRLNAIATKRKLINADHRAGRGRRQVLIATSAYQPWL